MLKIQSSIVKAVEDFFIFEKNNYMFENKTLSDQENPKSVQEYVISSLIAEQPKRLIIATLLEKGIDEEEAKKLIADGEDKLMDAERAAANKDIIYGAIWLVVGIAITFSGVGVITYGAIIYGLFRLFKGLSNTNIL